MYSRSRSFTAGETPLFLTIKEPHLLSRRKLLFSGAALSGLGFFSSSWIGSVLAQQVSGVTTDDAAQLHQLSLFLTERDALDPSVLLRVLARCTEADPLFTQKVSRLWAQIQQQGVSDVGVLVGSQVYQDPEMKDTVQKIVRAWYLGYTGTPVSLRAVDDTELVTFTGALAYTPTLDATVIPTYSRGQTNYWVKPPSTVAND